MPASGGKPIRGFEHLARSPASATNRVHTAGCAAIPDVGAEQLVDRTARVTSGVLSSTLEPRLWLVRLSPYAVPLRGQTGEPTVSHEGSSRRP
jgi:hypothetical protein